MKKLLILCLFVFLVAGCSSPKDFETMADTYTEPNQIQARQILLKLPPEASMATIESDNVGKIYLCDGYTLTVQTMESGDLNKTLKTITGFSRDMLMVIETAQDSLKRYDCAWTTVGEGGEQTCRAAILDDGNYYYAVSVMADYTKANTYNEEWSGIFGSFSLINTGA